MQIERRWLTGTLLLAGIGCAAAPAVAGGQIGAASTCIAQSARIAVPDTRGVLFQVDEARGRRLSIIGLELPDEQVAAFDAIPLPAQVALVRFLLLHGEELAADHEAVIGRVFVAVGASHLVGRQSLLTLLREQSYRVRRLF